MAMAVAVAGLAPRKPGAIQITAAGRYLVRAVVAMVFDRWLQGDPLCEGFSRVV